LRRKDDAIRYGVKPKQQVIGINIKRQDEIQGECCSGTEKDKARAC